MNVFKKIFFMCHILGIIITTSGWLLYSEILFLHPIVILSWYFNNNKCLITQLEYYIFKETFLGKGEKYYVPSIFRYILYINFILGIFIRIKIFDILKTYQ